MERKFLEDLGLEKEVIDKIMAENGKDVQAEQAKTSTKEKELELANNQLKEANKTIKSYKDMDIDKIKESATDWEQKAKEAQKEVETVRNNAALERALSKTDVVDADLLIDKILDRDSLKFKDGEVIGLEEQLSSLKGSKPYLFKGETGPSEGGESNGDDGRFTAHDPEPSNGDGKSTMESAINNVFEI